MSSHRELDTRVNGSPLLWTYIDDEGQEQGPFTEEDMRIWFGVGWLREDILVKQYNCKRSIFKPLKSIQPSPAFARTQTAFKFPPPPAPPAQMKKQRKKLPKIRKKEAESKWRYIDVNGEEQGPFPMSRIGAWLVMGHFNDGTMVRPAIKGRVFEKIVTFDGGDRFRGAAKHAQDAKDATRVVVKKSVNDFDVDDQVASNETVYADARIWYYKDDNGVVQGPFTGRNMSVWHRADYIDANVLVRRDNDNEFWTLGDDVDVFVTQPPPEPKHEWLYLDDDNTEQGPFPSDHMRAWFEEGYVLPSNRVKRDDHNDFVILANYHPLPDFLDAPLPRQVEAVPREPTPPPPPVEDQWFYIDGADVQQGPFTTGQMRIWYAAGHFTMQLRVSLGGPPSGEFIALGLKERSFMKADDSVMQQRAYEQQQQKMSMAQQQRSRDQARGIAVPEYTQHVIEGGVLNSVSHRLHSAGASHWAAKGLPSDRAGRQMAHYFDADAYQVEQNERIRREREKHERAMKKQRMV